MARSELDVVAELLGFVQADSNDEKVLRKMAELLSANRTATESITHALFGSSWDDRTLYSLLVLTEMRVISISCVIERYTIFDPEAYRPILSQVGWSDIATVDVSREDGKYTISATGYGNAGKARGMWTGGPPFEGRKFLSVVDFIQERVAAIKRGGISQGPAEGTAFINELERLAVLRQSGALTEDEFQRAKAKLLS